MPAFFGIHGAPGRATHAAAFSSGAASEAWCNSITTPSPAVRSWQLVRVLSCQLAPFDPMPTARTAHTQRAERQAPGAGASSMLPEWKAPRPARPWLDDNRALLNEYYRARPEAMEHRRTLWWFAIEGGKRFADLDVADLRRAFSATHSRQVRGAVEAFLRWAHDPGAL